MSEPVNEPALPDEDFAELVKQIREEGKGLLENLADAKQAAFDASPKGAFIDPRPIQEVVLKAWLEANHYEKKHYSEDES